MLFDCLFDGLKCVICGVKLMNVKLVEVDVVILVKVVWNDDVLLIVDFWVVWCGLCWMMVLEFVWVVSGL